MSNKQEQDLRDAVEYFEMGFLDELTNDKKHYVEILIEHAKKSL